MAFLSNTAGVTQTVASQLGTASRDSATLAGDFDDFLSLLTTQLQNQDPTDPLDSSEFTNQLVQFTGVEQQIRLNQNVENLTQVTLLGNIGSVASYLNNEALIEAPFGDHSTDGIQWQYSHRVEVETANLTVEDEDGNVIFEAPAETGQGVHDFRWDGRDNEGNLVEPGNYGLRVTAANDDGNETVVGIAVRDQITGVDTTGLEPVFQVGPNFVPQTQILRLFGT
ncbi:flagellar hook assembly protein FlgD [Kordiimonas laminariae]|uniref:flagellar hook assembly protein FlgD n=1 Tax=Kordiimonas laminariae TaxID=2917717 RepID=UPI001FF5EF15|nr:flagellar hook capping FlgD N-terminal domain-containing protein [Kordiimonas laminariae]MCK0068724.1 hypothetical protein [Kordiimonas laminariae]